MVDVPEPRFSVGNKTFTQKANPDLVHHYGMFNNAKQATERNRQRQFENLKVYAGVDNSQWPSELQDFLRSENRGTNYGSFVHLGQYNFSKNKINGIAGSLIRNPFDATYIANAAEQGPQTMALNQAYLSDKDKMDWNYHKMLCYTMGLIHEGLLRMYVRVDHPAQPQGNIAIESFPPGSFMLDPDWKSGISKELRNIWTFGWFTAPQIRDKYNAKKELVERDIWLLENFGAENYQEDQIDWNRDLPVKHGDRYLVVQQNYLKLEKVTREFDPVTGTVLWEWMSDDDKQDTVEKNFILPENIKSIEVKDYVEHAFAFAPALSLQYALLDEKEEFQCGRLKYFPWSTEYVNGQPAPMMDQLRDAQLETNQAMATMSLAAKSAVTSGVYLDEAIFGMDEGKINEFIENRGNPHYVARLKAGSSRMFPNGMGEIVKQQIPGDVFNISNMMIDLMDRLVPQPAASEGRTERSGESGILFAQKVEVAKTMQTTMLASIRQMDNDLAEAYFFVAKQLYSKGPRTFTNASGTEATAINTPRITQEGELVIDNDFSALPYHSVVISEAPSGVNNRLVQRELNATLMQSFQHLPALAVEFGGNMIKSLDLDEEAKERAMQALDMERQRIEAETQAAIANAKASAGQAQAVAGGPAQGGLPPEGGLPPQGGLPPELVGGFQPEPQISKTIPELRQGV